MALLAFLDREKSVAHPGYSRWLVPPAALAIHLSIGQVYAFSVFKIPLTQLLGVGKSKRKTQGRREHGLARSSPLQPLAECRRR